MKALIPGSFDPITKGHINIIERSADIFDKVYVAVMNNDSSKYDKSLASKSYMFDMNERVEIAKLSVGHIHNVEVISYSGMLIDLFDSLNADVIVKGVRTKEDYEYELIHAKWNKEHNLRAETLFLPAEDGLGSVSSTVVRELIKEKKYDELSPVLCDSAIEYISGLKR